MKISITKKPKGCASPITVHWLDIKLLNSGFLYPRPAAAFSSLFHYVKWHDTPSFVRKCETHRQPPDRARSQVHSEQYTPNFAIGLRGGKVHKPVLLIGNLVT